MTCEDREKKLPAYLEGELPPGELEEIETHLSSCENCRRTLEHLKTTGHFVRSLAEVEPPPWLKQQVMTRVREAHAQRKGFWHKFFFPLQVKIPVQAFAVIVITVLAFYVYRQDEPRMRMTGIPLPPAPVFEVKKEPVVPQTRLSRSKVAAPSGNTESEEAFLSVPQMNQAERAGAYSPPEPSEKAEDTLPGELTKDAREDEAKTAPILAEKSQVPQDAESAWHSVMKEKRAAPGPPQGVAGAGSRICEQDVCVANEYDGRSTVGQSVAKGTVMKDMQPSLELFLTVKDVAAAVLELEKYVESNAARTIEITAQENQQVFTTEIKPHLLETFLEKLNTIGILSDHARPEFGKDTQWVKIRLVIVASADQSP